MYSRTTEFSKNKTSTIFNLLLLLISLFFITTYLHSLFSWKSKTVIKIICHFKLYTYIYRILKKKNKKITVIIKQTISWCKNQFEKIYDTSLNTLKGPGFLSFFMSWVKKNVIPFFSFTLKELTFKITVLKLGFKKKHRKSDPQSH